MIAWETLFTLVKNGIHTVQQGATLARAALNAYEDVASGRETSALASIQKHFPETLPLIESIANMIVPGAGTGIQIVAFMLAHAHKMTADEERAWMDRASGSADAPGV